MTPTISTNPGREGCTNRGKKEQAGLWTRKRIQPTVARLGRRGRLGKEQRRGRESKMAEWSGIRIINLQVL